LIPQGFSLFRMFLDGTAAVNDVLTMCVQFNPKALYLLFGATASGVAHVVVCRGETIEHDPAWVRSPFVGPSMTYEGEPVWMVATICRS
jgi:hypothetical protein